MSEAIVAASHLTGIDPSNALSRRGLHHLSMADGAIVSSAIRLLHSGGRTWVTTLTVLPPEVFVTGAHASLTSAGCSRLAVVVVDRGRPVRRAPERFPRSPTTLKRWPDRCLRELAPSRRSRRTPCRHRCPRTLRPCSRPHEELRLVTWVSPACSDAGPPPPPGRCSPGSCRPGIPRRIRRARRRHAP